MATTIDKKIVEMQFNNSQFETNVNQSISSIDSLKNSLNFSGLSNSAVSSLSSISTATTTVTTKFSALAVAAISAISTIASSITSDITDAINSLSIDQIAEGWSKYEEITKNVRTIMAATRDEWEDQGAQMDYVSEKVDRLNWYTDETSWNLSDMTSNIGKFTSAGIDLEDAVVAMQGIGNWAGISGASVAEMSRAMYNLSQAMSTGGVYLRDWMSIENANMATREFKQTAIDTAVALGTLEEVEEGVWETTTGTTVTLENFRNTLNTDSGNWFNSDVLVEVLNKYGEFNNVLYEVSESLGLSATKILTYADQYKIAQAQLSETAEKFGEENLVRLEGYIQDYQNGLLSISDLETIAESYGVTVTELTDTFETFDGVLLDWNEISEETGKEVWYLRQEFNALTDDYYELGYASFKASQEAVTFTEAIQATKDAVSTQWSNIFSNIFGEYLESKELWTKFCNDLYDIFVEDLWEMNYALSNWGDMGGRDDLITGLFNLWDNFKDILTAVKEGFAEVFPQATADTLYEITENFREFTEEIRLNEDQLELIKDTASKFANVLDVLWSNIKTIAGSISDAWSRIFPTPTIDETLTTLDGFATALSNVAEMFRINDEQASKLERTFAGIFAVLDVFWQLIVAILEPITGVSVGMGSLGDGILDVTASIGDQLVAFDEWLKENDIFRLGIAQVVEFIQSIPDKLNKVCIDLFGIPLDQVWLNIKTAALAAWDAIYTFFVNIPTYAEQTSQALFGMSLDELFETIKQAASDCWNAISEFSRNIWSEIEKILNGTSESKTDVEDTGNAFQNVIEKIGEALQKFKDMYDKISPYIQDFLDQLSTSIDFQWPSGEEMGEGLASGGFIALLALVITLIVKFVSTITSFAKDAKKISSSIADFFENLSTAAGNFAKAISANTLKTIATAILELAAAIFVLSIIDTGKMISSSLVIAGLLGELALIMTQFDSLTMDSKKFSQIKTMLLELMVVIAELTAALWLLSGPDMNYETMLTAAIMMGLLMAEIAGIMTILDSIDIDESKATKVAASLTVLAFAMVEIGIAMALVTSSADDWTEVATAGASLAVMIIVLSAALALLPDDSGMLAKAVALDVVSVSVVIIAAAFKLLEDVDITTLLVSLAGFVILIAELTGALILLSKNDVAGAAGSLVLASVGIIALAVALAILAQCDPVNLAVALGVLVVALIALGIAAVALVEYTAVLDAIGVAFALIGVGALAAGAGLLLAATGLTMLEAVGVEGIKAICDMLETLFEMIPELIPLVVDAIVTLVDELSNRSGEFTGSFGTFLDAMLESVGEWIQKVLDKAVELSESISETVKTIYNTVVETISDLILTTLDLINELYPKITETVTNVVDQTSDAATTLAPKVREILNTVMDTVYGVLTDQLPKLFDFLITQVSQLAPRILLLISGLSPQLIDTLLSLLEQVIPPLLEMIESYGPRFIEVFYTLASSMAISLKSAIVNFAVALVETLIDAVFGLLEYIVGKIDELIKLLFFDLPAQIIKGLVDGIMSNVMLLVTAGTEAMFNFIDGMSEAIVNNAERFRESMKTLATALIDAFCIILGINSPSTVFVEIGDNIIQGLINGLNEMLGNLLSTMLSIANSVITTITDKYNEFKTKGQEIITKIRDGINEKFSIVKEKVTEIITGVISFLKDKLTEFKTKGTEIITKIHDGIVDVKNKIRAKVVEIISDVADYLNEQISKWKQVGKDLIDGLKKGIEAKAQEVINSVKDLAEDVIDTAESVFDINSPSKVFEKIGMYNDEGLAGGIRKYASLVLNASEDLAEDSIDSVSDVISRMSEIVDNEMDTTPTIRPVLDLTDVMNGASTIGDMLNADTAIGLANSSDMMFNSGIEEASRVSTALEDLKNVLSNFEKNQNGVVNNNTFNITGNNPKEIADEVSRIIQFDADRRNAAWGL